jgi:hypothetical protein
MDVIWEDNCMHTIGSFQIRYNMIADTVTTGAVHTDIGRQIVRPGREVVSVYQNLQQLKIDHRFFWGQNTCIVIDAFSPIFSTGINEIKYLSIPLIQLRLII